ncbi:hypothetical protein [Deinococcus sp. PEB2-63]
MTTFLIFIVLPVVLIVLALRMKPLIPPDERTHDPLGASSVAGGMFGSHGLEADPVSVREDTEQVRFDLTAFSSSVEGPEARPSTPPPTAGVDGFSLHSSQRR